MQVSDLQPLGKKHKGKYSDGDDSIETIFASSVSKMIESKEIGNGCVVKVISFTCNIINESHKLICTECELEAACDTSTSAPFTIKQEVEDSSMSPASKENMPSNLKQEDRQPGSPAPLKRVKTEGSDSNTPHAARRDSDAVKTPAHPRIASLAASRTPQPSPSEQ